MNKTYHPLPVPQTRNEFLEEMVAYYSEDPKGRRSVFRGTMVCMYNAGDGRRCAIGRYLSDEVAEACEGLGVDEVPHLLPVDLERL